MTTSLAKEFEAEKKLKIDAEALQARVEKLEKRLESAWPAFNMASMDYLEAVNYAERTVIICFGEKRFAISFEQFQKLMEELHYAERKIEYGRVCDLLAANLRKKEEAKS